MSEKNKLHPLTLVTALFNRAKRLIVPIVFLVFLNIGEESMPIFLILLFVVVFLVSYSFDVVRYLRTSYWVEGNRFVLQTGIFIRNEKDVQISRIQSIDYQESIVHRVFHLTKLEIKTPGKGISLDALSKAQALQLADYLHHLKDRLKSTVEIEEDEEEAPSASMDQHSGFSLQQAGVTKELYAMSLIDIVKMNAMGDVILKGFLVVVGGINIFAELIPEAWVARISALATSATWTMLTVLVIGVFLIVYIIGTLFSVIRNFEYKVELTKDYITIEKGLFEVKSQTVALKNVQSLREQRNWIQQLFGYTSFYIGITSDEKESNSDASKEVQEKGQILLLPLVKKKELTAMIQEILPAYRCDPAQAVVPIRSWRRFVQFPLLFLVVASVGTSLFVWQLAWIIGGILAVFYLFYGYRRYRKTGYALSQNELTLELPKWFSTETIYLRKERILQMTVKQQYFLKRSQLGKLEVASALGDSAQEKQLSFIEEKDCQRLYDWFVEEGKAGEYGTTKENQF